MASSVLNILVGLWLITCFAAAKNEPYVPALYVFGDAFADAGNNDYIANSTLRANFIPYGVSYFPYPTGRFTNGRTIVDFLASCLGLPFPPPYLQPGANFASGVNFASSGSGLLDITWATNQIIMSMSQQVSLFEQYSDKLTEAEQGNLGNSLFAIVSGSNDIPSFISYFFKQRKNRDEFADLLLSKLTEHITRLYNHGARKFIVFDIPPLGCSPFFRHVAKLLPPLSDDKGCLEFLNFVVEPYNIAFRTSLTELAEKLDEATIIQVNDHDLVLNVIENGEAYGFINTTWACCGSGDFHTYPGCGKTIPPDLYCSDPNSYMFWDGGRGTEKLYSLISEQIWSGNTSFVYPFNLSTLLSAETCLNTNDASTLSEM